MDAEETGSQRDVAIAIGEDTLHVLPFHARQRRDCFRHLRAAARRGPQSLVSRQNLIRVGRLAQVMIGAFLIAEIAVGMLPYPVSTIIVIEESIDRRS